jgi:hypothetical protein
MANWRRPERVDQAWIAYASGRVYVAVVSPDFDAGTLKIGLDGFEAGSGKRLWAKNHDIKVNAVELKHLIESFTADKDSLTYSVGSQRWTVRSSDGTPLPAAPDFRAAARPVAPPPFLWPPSGFRAQDRRLFAFTADGHAYAMLSASSAR